MSDQHAGPETQAIAADEVARIRRRQEAEEIVDGSPARAHQLHAVLAILSERDEALTALDRETEELVNVCQAVSESSGLPQGDDEPCTTFILRAVNALVQNEESMSGRGWRGIAEATGHQLAERDAVLDAIAMALGLDHEKATDEEIKAAVVRAGVKAATARAEADTAKTLATDLAAVVRRTMDEARQQAADIAEARIRASLTDDQRIALDTAAPVKSNVGAAFLGGIAGLLGPVFATMIAGRK